MKCSHEFMRLITDTINASLTSLNVRADFKHVVKFKVFVLLLRRQMNVNNENDNNN